MSVIHFTAEEFENQVLGGGVALIDFWAEWCGPCRMLAPVVEELGDELDGTTLVGKVDIDAQPELAARFGVMSIPTVIFFRDGVEVQRLVGLMPKQRYLDLLK